MEINIFFFTENKDKTCCITFIALSNHRRGGAYLTRAIYHLFSIDKKHFLILQFLSGLFTQLISAYYYYYAPVLTLSLFAGWGSTTDSQKFSSR